MDKTITIKEKIRTISNWPKEGIEFRDITTLLKDPKGFQDMIDLLYEHYKHSNITAVVGIESRGFIVGSVLAYKLGVGFIPVRKPGKLPGATISQEYALEYGIDEIQIHSDAIQQGDTILLADDLIATGGTALAASSLIKKLGGQIVGCCFIVDLPDLGGSQKLKELGLEVYSLVEFEGE